MFGSINQNAVKKHTTSFLAFTFMPQWRTMLPAFSHLMPIMVRVLAMLFVQAELLRPNHPATMYGIARGDGIRIRDLVFEAWNNIRFNAGFLTVYQSSIFISLALLVVLVFAAAFLSLVEIAKIVLPATYAQVFDHPTGGDTSFVAVPAGTPTDLFDQSFPTQAGGDLAIDILNKVLRQGAAGASGTGGILQNALGELFRIYNTAILLVGSILVFWAVVSVVLDTSRTGQIGGGDKSITWLAMRFVLAIGLIIPMDTGFNAGQYFVMKLSEMGSNFGSQAWSAYVGSAINESLLVPYSMGDPTSIVVADVRNAVCLMSMNTSLQAMRGPTSWAELQSYDAYVYMMASRAVGIEPTGAPVAGGAAAGVNDVPGETFGIHRSNNLFFYGNEISDTFCGGFIIPSPDDPRIAAPFVATDDRFAEARREMRRGYWNGYLQVLPFNAACGFIYQNFPDRALRIGGVPTGTYGYLCTAARLTACSFSAYNAVPVDQPVDCVQTLATNYANEIRNAYVSNVLPILQGYVNGAGAGTLRGRVDALGWAGMGIFYHEISRLNALVADFSDGGVRVIEPDFGGKDEAANMALTGSVAKTREVLAAYDQWWQNTTALIPAASRVAIDSSGAANEELTTRAGVLKTDESLTYKKLYSFIEGSEGEEKLDVLMNLIVPGDGWSLVDISHYKSLYPLALLQKIGEGLMTYAVAGIAVNMAISITSFCELKAGFSFIIKIEKDTDCGDIFLTILESPIGQLIDAIVGLFFVSAMILLFVVPILPWIRVTFAVMAWIFTVFEAVIMISLVALMHLRVTEESLFMQSMRDSYILLLNLLLRPVLVVVGFVGGLLIFNAMVGYVNLTFEDAVRNITSSEGPSYLQRIFYTVSYVGMIYALANASFKLIDQTPNWALTWLGVQRDHNFDDNKIESLMYAGVAMGQGISNLSTTGSERARKRGSTGQKGVFGAEVDGVGVSKG